MATKTDDVTKTDDERAPEETAAAEAGAKTGPADENAAEGLTEETEESEQSGEPGEPEEAEALQEKGPSGVGQGAAAVVSAALGLVSLSGGWIGTVAAARETLVGQLQTASTASVGKQVKEVYGDAWHTTALWAGLFALAALITGVVVLARPAFGAPGRPQAAWIKSVAWAGVSLGVLGLLLAVLKYSDVLIALPSTG
ncbi:VIT1/CCC1 family predicted Fe2+/Mn2+ transporter [Streptomyces griseochromogenes]|uniref:VIT1/CCC1 family predicted Fe2+/Mn2+ transporter n=1 Tax=Streptomyces griseochromogenes TaxID=68214 RepID=A0A1B1AT04_9ACTN|nr:hypothetical protein [Streptomyces griseochromogenes]ANP49652.1 hypothetical protein AVL59_08555 [Streptomyces griseochromogenes]MBP2051886.1 VIT1/CCC1 family predicted Fe2+/Mn2+ transporter [Streptomyces griseochromogenes]